MAVRMAFCYPRNLGLLATSGRRTNNHSHLLSFSTSSFSSPLSTTTRTTRKRFSSLLQQPNRMMSGYYGSSSSSSSPGVGEYHATTILSVRKGDRVVVIGDGQVSHGPTVLKPNAIKVRRLSDKVIVGYAGVTADALCLYELLEQKLEAYPNQLLRSCVEMAKAWRLGRELRRLEAEMIVADPSISLTITGHGDVIQSPDGLVAIGSGGLFAISAARALVNSGIDLDAESIAHQSMKVAADLCIYTNHEFVIEKLGYEEKEETK